MPVTSERQGEGWVGGSKYCPLIVLESHLPTSPFSTQEPDWSLFGQAVLTNGRCRISNPLREILLLANSLLDWMNIWPCVEELESHPLNCAGLPHPLRQPTPSPLSQPYPSWLKPRSS